MKLRVYHYEKETTVLGKGKRFALWVQGCNQECNHCLVPDSWELNGGELIEIEKLVKMVGNTKGITISGGEPFLQSKALCYFLDMVDDDIDIIVYSGFSYQQIVSVKSYKNFLDRIDLLIDGVYIDTLNIDEPLVGSSNQNIYILSDKGEKLANYMTNMESREIEFVIKADEIFTVGVPPKKLKGLI